MSRARAPLMLLSLSLLSAQWAAPACVTAAAPTPTAPSPPPPVAPAPEAPAPVEPRPIEGSGAAAVVAALAPETAGALRARELARLDELLACAVEAKCASTPKPLPLDDGAVRALLESKARDVRVRAAAASVARAVVEEALRSTASERHARRRALTFRDGAAVFALDDLPVLLERAPRSERARLLAAAQPALARAVDIAAEERALLEAESARLGVGRAQLLARRGGFVDDGALRSLIDATLRATEPLLGVVAGDVTLVPEVLAAGRGRAIDARKVVAAARPAADPLIVEAFARAGAIRPGPAETEPVRLWARALTVELRAAALAARHSIDADDDGGPPDVAVRDAAASRLLTDDPEMARAITGASAFVTVDETGAAIERFVAILRTPALVQALWTGASTSDAAARWLQDLPLEEQEQPESFVEGARLLVEVAAR